MKSLFHPTPTLRYERMFLLGFASALGALVAMAFLQAGLQSLHAGLAPGELALLGAVSLQALSLLLLAGAFALLALALLLFMLVKVQVRNKLRYYHRFVAVRAFGFVLVHLAAALVLACAIVQIIGKL